MKPRIERSDMMRKGSWIHSVLVEMKLRRALAKRG
jgi:hypothetical protein